MAAEPRVAGRRPSLNRPGMDWPASAGIANLADLVFQVQRKLAKAGYDPGPPDGVLGPRTETAIRRFQQQEGLEVDGRPSWRLLEIIPQKGSPNITN